jgi:hypothetical protein
MKRRVIAVVIGSLFALPAFADGEIGFEYWNAPVVESSKTRVEVLAELVATQRSGDFVVDSETGRKASQLWPSLYPAQVSVAGKTRDEVLAELVEAKRTGDFVVDGELGLKANQLFPDAYRQPALASGAQKRRM